MKRYKVLIVCMSVLLLNFQCDDDDVNLPPTDCDRYAFVDNDEYENATSAFFEINDASINGDCLEIEFTASGCNSESWILQVFSTDDILESFPVQRNIRAVLINDEACLAVFTRTLSVDLRNLQVEDAQQVRLNLLDYSESILYSY